MGYLLKEALKTLCGSNQWSYAVFWKIGCQNPKLLIWEECHYEPSKSSLPTHMSGAGSAELPFEEWERLWMSSETCSSQLGSQVGDRVSSLISKMMINNQFNIVGEGMVGRAAFTGNHQWILSNNYTKFAHPPEVLNEMHHQFSAGMQTVAVIPVRPHGVVQLGSSLAIMEDIGFVNDVKSLILQLGRVRGALLSDNYVAKDAVEKIGIPVTAGVLLPMDLSGIHKMENSSAYVVDSYNPQKNLSQASSLVQLPNSLRKKVQNNQDAAAIANVVGQSHGNPCQANYSSNMKPYSASGSQIKDGIVGAEVIPSSSNAWPNRQASARSRIDKQCGFSQSGSSQGSLVSLEERILSSVSIHGQSVDNQSVSNSFNSSVLKTSGSLLFDENVTSLSIPFLEGKKISGGINRYSWPVSVPCSRSSTHMAADVNLSGALSGIELQKAETLKTEEVSFSCMSDQLVTGPTISKGFDVRQLSKDVKVTQNDLLASEQRMDNELFQALNFPLFHADGHMSPSDRIPDFVLDCQNLEDKPQCSGSTNAKLEDQCTRASLGDDLFAVLGMDYKNKLLNGHRLDGRVEGMPENTSTFTSMEDMDSSFYSDSGIFSGMGTDHLLDAVVSKAHIAAKQSSEDNVSCRTTLTKISSSSVPSISPTHGHVNLPNQVRGQKLQLPESLDKAGMVKTSSFKSGCSKDETGNCSQTTSIYGSQMSSWVEQGNCMKHENSVSTAYSKRPDEIGKSNRKRLKPGENPRPRPKDRQMIQDRVKELREIVPNGAKCSIDALLERTIKHMLFLQSVTKHADKLKQTGESKIINKEGGLLLKDNFEGGATWAFEVGSQSMVCPIIVEDLNSPRQMLVEMLCEERGFFLEIADLIRGMGLTILKGVMEARNDKIWARFAIEANRDVTRMEIFMSLVHLLEQTVKGGTSSANATENNTLMVHDSFSQAAPIPATGRSGNLQ
ncbi:hypothetical protein L484_022306 [Morus notabilis]|uniref:BHLH domain-containing protein n=1 Tax=Morus notabilis TaxID=981085 RepID=W9QRI8_9ROSA|nr:transcription factor LHW [Morus notabilis]EXB38407.1 hypothetical protein L484_022306 [Morus notabilis]